MAANRIVEPPTTYAAIGVMNESRARIAPLRLSGTTLVFIFIFVAILPMLAALASGAPPTTPLSELGTAFALTASALLFLQFLSSGRYESLSGRVGIDRTMGFHRIAAYVLLLFALLHPLSYAADTFFTDPAAAWNRLTGMLVSNRLRTGVLALVGLLIIVGLATIRSRLRYEFWRASHGLLAITVTGLVLHHALVAGSYSAQVSLELVWLLFAMIALIAIGVVYLVRPWRMWHEDWRVEGVKPLADRVWEMTLRGPSSTRLHFRAGQFIWITVAPKRPPIHDHPFSIASAPSELPRLRPRDRGGWQLHQ
jgi:predicted ferric reductase